MTDLIMYLIHISAEQPVHKADRLFNVPVHPILKVNTLSFGNMDIPE